MIKHKILFFRVVNVQMKLWLLKSLDFVRPNPLVEFIAKPKVKDQDSAEDGHANVNLWKMKKLINFDKNQ